MVVEETGCRPGGIPQLILNGSFDGQRGFGFRRELQHDLTTARRDIILVEGVERLLAFFADVDETRIAQNGEMVRDGWLGEPDLFHDLVDREPATATRAHDLLAGFIGDGFGEEDRVEFHLDIFPSVII